ncbi:MAG: hypothetical protein OXH22_05900 [Chloroflexi bacterium]|nr:hypothetical protein [Chloroflexota bacterium]
MDVGIGVGVGAGVEVGRGVEVGGIGVCVGTGVAVGGTDVFVGIGVAVGGTVVFVGSGVSVGGMGVDDASCVGVSDGAATLVSGLEACDSGIETGGCSTSAVPPHATAIVSPVKTRIVATEKRIKKPPHGSG